MDFITDCAKTWGHIAVGFGLLGMILVSVHQFVTWCKNINDINRQVRKNG